MTIGGLLARVERLDTDRAIDDALAATARDAVRLQREQLMAGKNAQGGRVGTYRSFTYAVMKSRLNPLPGFGVVDARLTGALHRSLFVDVRPDALVFGATDFKARFVFGRYPGALGLNDESLPHYRRIVRPSTLR